MEIGTQFNIFLDLYARRAIPLDVQNYRITLGDLTKTPDNKSVTIVDAIYEDQNGFEVNREIGTFEIIKGGYIFYGPCVGNDYVNRDEVYINYNGLKGKLVELVSIENGIKKFATVELSYNFNDNNELSLKDYLDGKFQEIYELVHKGVSRI